MASTVVAQRPAGRHEIMLYLGGHKTVREKVYLSTTAPSRRRQPRGGRVTDAATGR